MDIIMNDRNLSSHTGRPSQEIATSPTFMAGCPAQPREGTQNINNSKTIKDIGLKILSGYGGHVGASVYQRRTKLVYRWHCKWPQCTHTFSPNQTVFLLITIYVTLRYLSVYISIQLYRSKQKFPIWLWMLLILFITM